LRKEYKNSKSYKKYPRYNQFLGIGKQFENVNYNSAPPVPRGSKAPTGRSNAPPGQRLIGT